MRHFIYKLTNKKTKKVYIGETKDVERRKSEHYRFIKQNKIGEKGLYEGDIEDWIFEVVEVCEYSERYQRESFWIHEYNSIENGYNIADGKSKPHTIDSKKKISEGNKGKQRSEQQRKRISECRKGKPLTEEQRKKISISTKKAFQKEEIKENLHRGQEAFCQDKEKYDNYRKKLSDSLRQHYIDHPEDREKCKSNCKPVYMCDEEGSVLKEFDTVSEVLIFLGLKGHTSLYKALKEGKKYKGYYWKFK